MPNVNEELFPNTQLYLVLTMHRSVRAVVQRGRILLCKSDLFMNLLWLNYATIFLSAADG